jgi:hypothetical protein
LYSHRADHAPEAFAERLQSNTKRKREPMTSDQIKNDNNLDSQYFWIWLKECAYQLAVMNERQDVPKLKHNPFGESLASTVPPGSDSALRGERPSETMARVFQLWNTARGELDAANQHVKILEADRDRLVRVVMLLRDRNAALAHGQPTSGPPTEDLAAKPNSNTKEDACGNLL